MKPRFFDKRLHDFEYATKVSFQYLLIVFLIDGHLGSCLTTPPHPNLPPQGGKESFRPS
jgi:hypothetical protein